MLFSIVWTHWPKEPECYRALPCLFDGDLERWEKSTKKDNTTIRRNCKRLGEDYSKFEVIDVYVGY